MVTTELGKWENITKGLKVCDKQQRHVEFLLEIITIYHFYLFREKVLHKTLEM